MSSSLRRTFGEMSRAPQPPQQPIKDAVTQFTLDDLRSSNGVSPDYDKQLGFVISRQQQSTGRHYHNLVALLKTISGFSYEEAIAFWIGCTALPNSDLIRFCELNPEFFVDLIVSNNAMVRLASVNAMSNVLARMLAWFSVSAMYDTWDELEETQSTVEQFIRVVYKALVGRTRDEDARVALAAIECLECEFGSAPPLLREMKFMLPPHQSIGGILLTSNLVQTEEERRMLICKHLLPQMQFTQREELQLVSAECAIKLMLRDANIISPTLVSACCNTAIRLAGYNRKRSLHVIFAVLDLNQLASFGETMRLLAACTLMAVEDDDNETMLRKCCEKIIQQHQRNTRTFHALFCNGTNSPLALTLGAWKTRPPRIRDRFIILFLDSVRGADNELLAREVMFKWEDCLTWLDDGAHVSRSYVNLSQHVLLSQQQDATSEIVEFVRNVIEWKLASVQNVAVRVRFAWALERAYCHYLKTDEQLGHSLVDAIKTLALTCIISPPLAAVIETKNLFETSVSDDGNDLSSLFPSILSIFSHLTWHAPLMRSHVSTLLQYLNTKASLSGNQAWMLQERRLEIKQLIANGCNQPVATPSNNNNIVQKTEIVKPAQRSVEKRLSALHDPLCVFASVKREDSTQLTCLVRVINLTEFATGAFTLRCSGKRGVTCEDEHTFTLPSGLPTLGSVVQWKFALREDLHSNNICAVQTPELGIEIQGDLFTYSLLAWQLPSSLWFNPSSSSLTHSQFISKWNMNTTAHCSRVQVQFAQASTPLAWQEVFRHPSCFSAWQLVHCTNRIASFATEGEGFTLLCTCQVMQTTAHHRLQLEFRCSNRPVFGFKAKQTIADLFPVQAVIVQWNKQVTLDKSPTTTTDGDDYKAQIAKWKRLIL